MYSACEDGYPVFIRQRPCIIAILYFPDTFLYHIVHPMEIGTVQCLAAPPSFDQKSERNFLLECAARPTSY